MLKGYNKILSKWLASGIPGLTVEHLDANTDIFFYTYKKLGKKFIITPSLSPYACIHLSDDEESFAKEIDAFLRSEHPKAYTDLHLKAEYSLGVKFESLGYSVDQKFNYVLDIKSDLDHLRSGLSSTRKRHLNKAAKEIEVLDNSRTEESFELFRKTYEENNLSVPAEFFERLESGFFKDELIISSTVHNDRVVAANLCLQSDEVAIYLLGGINKNLAPPFAGTASMWNCVLKAKEKGALKFDFCGSGIPSIASYFSSFGASPEPFIQIKKGHEKIDLVKKIKSRILS